MLFAFDNYILDCYTYQVVSKHCNLYYHHAELLIADGWPCLHFEFLMKISPLIILSKNLRFFTTTNTTSTLDNFNEHLTFWV